MSTVMNLHCTCGRHVALSFSFLDTFFLSNPRWTGRGNSEGVGTLPTVRRVVSVFFPFASYRQLSAIRMVGAYTSRERGYGDGDRRVQPCFFAPESHGFRV